MYPRSRQNLEAMKRVGVSSTSDQVDRSITIESRALEHAVCKIGYFGSMQTTDLVKLHLKNDSTMITLLRGIVEMKLQKVTLLMTKVYYIPSLRLNIM